MTLTPNIGIYIPVNGETNYGESFASGMVNIDQHDHSGGPNKGVPISGSGIADFSITYNKLNANVVNPATGVGVSVALPNQIEILGVLKNIFQLAPSTGFITMDGNLAHSRTFQNTSTIVWTNPAGVSGNPSANLASSVTTTVAGTTNQIDVTAVSSGSQTISFSPTTLNATQPSFLANADAQMGVTGDGTVYTVTFDLSASNNFQRGGSNFDGISTFTAPSTGVYIVHSDLSLGGIVALNTGCEIRIYINGVFTYSDFNGNLGAVRNSGNGFVVSINQPMLLTSGDDVTIVLLVSGNVGTNINILDGTFSCVLLY